MPCWLIVLLLALTSCGVENGKFRLKGRLRNINQGEFWVYSPDGGFEGIDTIKVRDSRFSYEMDLTGEATLVIIFPNYSEQPVIAKSGAQVSIKGDASHLREMIIEGTEDNEDLTIFRMELNDLTPPDIPAAVSEYVTRHPRSLGSVYLVTRYFINAREPDYRQAQRLVALMLKENPDNGQLMQLDKQLRKLQGAALKSRLPKFTARDLQGKKVTEAALKAKANVVMTWATWSFQSRSMLRKMKELKQRYGNALGVVSISVDGSPEWCRKQIASDSLKWSTVCDGLMWDTPLLSKFGLGDVPGNVVIDGKGVVVARNLRAERLEDEIKKLLQ